MTARWGALFRTAYLLTGNQHHAEELLQDALARTCVKWAGIRDKGAADAYVRRILAHEATKVWRRRGRERLTDEAPEPSHDGGVESHELRLDLWHEIQQLPPRMRAVSEEGVFILRDDGLQWRHLSGAVTDFPDSVAWRPQVAGGRMLLSGSESENSKLLEVGSDLSTAVTIPGGWSALSPSGDQVVSIAPNEGDTGTVLRLWTGGDQTVELSGIDDRASEVRWLDDTTVVVAGWHGLYACSVGPRQCRKLDVPAGDVRIS